ncbi:fatty acid desaturase [Paenibacillus donghaensis]|uniref:Fatty acid desaturase n=1 Tax=Paenibacillus donghaensis TaxID=414771 RepID=A0A2Z2K7P4_9BACL|nr:fatty acid desaturase [Paenibacillus donghaensis]ASA21117.1 fatty acid desaturase [Paenibacillus donghaensis]
MTTKQTSQLSSLKKSVAPYEKNNRNASIRQLINSLGPLVLSWSAAYFSLSVSYWLTLVFAVITAGFVIRTFIICHDCCHGSFFKSRKANDIVGTITGIVSLVPYRQWKHSHSIHHAGSSNLDKRGIGDIWIMTVEEYEAASAWKRLYYRIYRNPLVIFGIGPIAVFVIQYRFNAKGARRKERMNTYITNLSIAALYGGMIWLIGWQAFLLVHLPIVFISGFLGIWLFYVQHQFEDTFFEKEDEWSYVKAAVEGSSYYKLPKLLQWFTGNIGFHHVHHLSPKVPNYNLEKAHNATPPLQQATTITIGTSLKAIRFRLWDEESKQFISFKQNKARMRELKSAAEELLKVRTRRLQGE